MKNRAALVLMEQLVVILVFALAASICLLAFSHAHRISAGTDLQDRAVELASNGCEVVKAHHGDLKIAGSVLGGTERDGLLLVCREGLRMEIRISDSQIPGLGLANVDIYQENTGECLYSLTASWQEVAS